MEWCVDGELRSLCRVASEDLSQRVINLRLGAVSFARKEAGRWGAGVKTLT